jgi:hypothetical protein
MFVTAELADTPSDIMVMSIALLIALGAFIIALLMTVGGHFMNWHAKIGLGMIAQVWHMSYRL